MKNYWFFIRLSNISTASSSEKMAAVGFSRFLALGAMSMCLVARNIDALELLKSSNSDGRRHADGETDTVTLRLFVVKLTPRVVLSS